MPVPTITWEGDMSGAARLIDQTLLPSEYVILSCATAESMWEAIRSLRVRGAPAIGVAAGMGVVLGVRGSAAASEPAFSADLEKTIAYLASARPTAVNLFWALDRMRAAANRAAGRGVPAVKSALFAEALAILEEDRAICRRIGTVGEKLIDDGDAVLTHCNAGGLATADYGTALALLYAAQERGKKFTVFADETRPLLQGARLTAWELVQAGIDVTVITDSMAGLVMREKKVRKVIVGADRIARNGDTANKIGTYSVAVLAREHGIPFYVVAPCSTFDLGIASGASIPIEERAASEIACGFGTRTAPEGARVYNPAFDVTPARYITAIVTERGIIEAPDEGRVLAVVSARS
jgi:methylthioribose-1-phosphate isomerase